MGLWGLIAVETARAFVRLFGRPMVHRGGTQSCVAYSVRSFGLAIGWISSLMGAWSMAQETSRALRWSFEPSANCWPVAMTAWSSPSLSARHLPAICPPFGPTMLEAGRPCPVLDLQTRIKSINAVVV